MANILAWAERVLKTVDSATGHAVARVRLVSVEGRTWETWHAPFGKVDDFVAEVNSVLEALEAEWPVKRIRMELVAEDAQGTTESTFEFSITGKNKAAAAAGFGGEGRAMTEQLEALTRTTEKLLGMVNNQVRLVDEHATKVTQSYHDLLDYQRVKAEAEALAAVQKAETTGEIGKQLLANLPAMLEMFQAFAPKGMQKMLQGARVAAAAAATASSGPNGHAPPNGAPPGAAE